MIERDIKLLLTAWGKWAGKGNMEIQARLGCGQPWARLQPLSGGVEVTADDEMLAVDNAMAWLKSKSPMDYKVLKLNYRYGYSNRRLASKLSRDIPLYRENKMLMCDKYAGKLVELAEQTVEQKVFDNLDLLVVA